MIVFFRALSGTMDVGSRKLLLLILLLNITVSVSGIQHVKVSCHPEKICALRESSVNLTCSYSNIIIITGFWFSLKDKAKWRKKEHPEDLALDSDYAGRVSYTEMTNLGSTLTITDLRERDSGEYRLVFITDKGEKYLSSAGVTLTVTDLQVTHNSTQQTLTCRTSCTLTFTVHLYNWHKNGKILEKYRDNMKTFPLSKAEEGSYSCSVEGYGTILSLPVCVGRSCYSVTYRDKSVCALEGSSVEFAGNYSHPSDLSVREVFWHYFQPGKVFQDLKQETQFTNRVEYVNQDKSSTFKMKNLTKKDSGEYCLRFLIDGEGFSGRPGVILSVTDLQVRASRSAVASEGQTTVTLGCITSCTLSNNPTYMWYRNGQPVTDKLTKHNKLYLNSSEDAGNYSCAVRGREDLRSPELTVTCVGRSCWSVTYRDKRVCAVEGSSVEFAGNYSHHSDLSVRKVFWHYIQSGKDSKNLKQETQFTNRVEYVKQDKSSTLKMKNLTKKDSGEYQLKFFTNYGNRFSAEPGVILIVTDLQVRASCSAVASEGQTTVTLSCITSCTLSNNPTYMWYKNGQPVTDKLTKHIKLYLNSSEDAGNYSCAVRGREDLRSPELTVTCEPQNSGRSGSVSALPESSCQSSTAQLYAWIGF
ncbi:sialoadhesin-like [Ictalurus punctatus]|uniref:Sialoadhesin-like n=1 Tax=Ictalurus punctatus TaxID=7998 RepID=A0A9F7RBP9_ICTPU|nr:sialoadhesin-like [Ictalurus punctatus]